MSLFATLSVAFFLRLSYALPCTISTSVLNSYSLSNLDGWTRCYFQPYSHHTSMAELRSSCQTGPNYYLFVGALASTTSTSAYIAAYAPAQVLTTDTYPISSAYKPTQYSNDPSYTVYWYNYPGKGFGFAGESLVNLNHVDNLDSNGDQRLSWTLITGYGGWRAGIHKDLTNDNTWYKFMYYKYCDSRIHNISLYADMSTYSKDDIVEFTMNISTDGNMVQEYFHTYWIFQNGQCEFPKLTFTFENIDFNETLDAIKIVDNSISNNSTLLTCTTSAKQCGNFTTCIDHLDSGHESMTTMHI
eukprot:325141_1